jgi:hypothetical protein
VLLASNVSTVVSSQNKSKILVFQCLANIDHYRYNMPLVWNHFASLSTRLDVM